MMDKLYLTIFYTKYGRCLPACRKEDILVRGVGQYFFLIFSIFKKHGKGVFFLL